MQMRATDEAYYYDDHAIMKHGVGHVVVRPADMSEESWLYTAKRGCEILNRKHALDQSRRNSKQRPRYG